MHGKLRGRLSGARQSQINCLTNPSFMFVCLSSYFSDRIAAAVIVDSSVRCRVAPCDSHWTQAHVMSSSKSTLTILMLLILGRVSLTVH